MERVARISAERPAVAIEAAAAPARARASNYPEPFAARMAGREKRPLGDLFGLTKFGVNLTRLAPGAVTALRHAHSRQDEFVYVLAGEPTLVTDAGETVLRPARAPGSRRAAAMRIIWSTAPPARSCCSRSATGPQATRSPTRTTTSSPSASRAGWRFVRKDGRPY